MSSGLIVLTGESPVFEDWNQVVEGGRRGEGGQGATFRSRGRSRKDCAAGPGLSSELDLTWVWMGEGPLEGGWTRPMLHSQHYAGAPREKD